MNKFSEKMADLTDAELFFVVRQKEHYQSEAVAAAYAEINSRGIEEDDFLEELVVMEKHRASLSSLEKLYYFFGALFIYPWFVRRDFLKGGFSAKYRTAGIFLKLGLTCYLGAYGIYLSYASHPVTPQYLWEKFQFRWESNS
ncbi:MAG: hypothetical protein ACFB10_03825 [Salibacteraceae bacterium]